MKKEIVDNLFNLKRNEIVLNIEKKSEFDLTGTHFGGLPAVPKGFKWPVYRDIEIGESYYINFLAQFNCEDLVQYDIEGILPQKGLLSFFYDIEGQPWTGISDRQGCLRVFLFENIENLICAEKPDDLMNRKFDNTCLMLQC